MCLRPQGTPFNRVPRCARQNHYTMRRADPVPFKAWVRNNPEAVEEVSIRARAPQITVKFKMRFCPALTGSGAFVVGRGGDV